MVLHRVELVGDSRPKAPAVRWIAVRWIAVRWIVGMATAFVLSLGCPACARATHKAGAPPVAARRATPTSANQPLEIGSIVPDLDAMLLAWCEAELEKAARDLGFENDWKAALEGVKGEHVAPGEQPMLVRDMAYEAVEYVESKGLVTIPALAKEIWRIEMMSPERQKTSPFFLGGEVLQVAYPTDGMSHEDKLMTMRGNAAPLARAVVHHEIIPGHHLQGFMTERHMPHRRAFHTPFWTEGWALHWELLLWDLGFPRTAEERMGMLFWRTHRCARVIFSLRFHLGEMSAEDCIDFLVERVGHEPENAEGEIRRSFGGDYSPLYQVAYLTGGLQFRALYRELVTGGKMTARTFHDAILRGGPIPVELVRARLRGQAPERDFEAGWRFADASRKRATRSAREDAPRRSRSG